MPKKTKLPVKLVKYLEKAGVKHEILEHRTVYTAIDAAATLRRKLEEIIKTLLIQADRDYYLILLPAGQNVDFDKLKKAIEKMSGKKIKSVKIPSEKIMEKVLKIKAGALSAFGQFHKLPVIAEKNLSKAKKVVLSGGSLNHSVEMTAKDFVKLENAVLASFGVKKKVKMAKAPVKRKTKKKKK